MSTQPQPLSAFKSAVQASKAALDLTTSSVDSVVKSTAELAQKFELPHNKLFKAVVILLLLAFCSWESYKLIGRQEWFNLAIDVLIILLIFGTSAMSPDLGIIMSLAFVLFVLVRMKANKNMPRENKRVSFKDDAKQSLTEKIAQIGSGQIADDTSSGFGGNMSGFAHDALTGVENGVNGIMTESKQLFSEF